MNPSNVSPTDSKVTALEKTEIEFEERNVEGADEGEMPSTTTSGQDYEKENIEEEEEKAINKADEEWHNQEVEEQKKNNGGEEDDVGVNDKLVSEKEADCSEDLASADLCEVSTSFFFVKFFLKACF